MALIVSVQEEDVEVDNVVSLSQKLMLYPTKNVLSGDMLWRGFDAELTKGILGPYSVLF